MENNSSNKHGALSVIQSTLDKALSDLKNLSDSDLAYYEAIKNLVDLKLNEAEIQNNFQSIEATLVSIGRLEFTERVPVEDAKDLFTYLGCSINFVAEELQDNAVPRAFLSPVMKVLVKRKPDLAMLVDETGLIRHISDEPSMLGYASKDLLKTKIQSLLAVDTHFMALGRGQVDAKEIHYIKPNSELAPVILSIDEIEHPNNRNLSHHLYSFCQIK